jgi:hypothetical protein
VKSFRRAHALKSIGALSFLTNNVKDLVDKLGALSVV